MNFIDRYIEKKIREEQSKIQREEYYLESQRKIDVQLLKTEVKKRYKPPVGNIKPKVEEPTNGKTACDGAMYSIDESDYVLTPEILACFVKDINMRITGKTFKSAMLEYMQEKELSAVDVYSNAQVLKQTFSKIMNNDSYHVSKDTAIQICFALHLTLEEAKEMIGCAGYYLSDSDRRDVLIKVLFEKGWYNIININEVLYEMNEKTFSNG